MQISTLPCTLVVGVAAILSPNLTAQHQEHLVMTFRGDASADNFGSALAMAGDVDNDGHVDVIVGARYDDNTGTNSGSARVFSGKDGRILFTFDGDSTGDYFGWAVDGAGDLNRDGFGDVVVGAPLDDNNGTSSGMARVLSGKDGTVLFSWDGAAAGDQFGLSVAGAGDVNLDGYADVIVGAPLADDPTLGVDSGMVQIFSGKDGTVLRTYRGDAAGDRLGHCVSPAGDVNRDVFADTVVGAPGARARAGMVRVYSGLLGNVLYTFYGDSAGDEMGNCVSDAGDVNRDGFGDVVGGAHYDDNNGTNSGMCRVYSGFDGKAIWSLDGQPGESQGWTVAGGSDVDGDGFPDVITGPGLAASPGAARVFSGRTGQLLTLLQGYQVGAGGDINGDGRDDVLSGTWLLNGVCWVYSGPELSLRTDVHEVPLSTGGTQTLSLHCGAANANRRYWIFGSITGVKPGITLGGVKIPLNPDVYTDLGIALVSVNPPFNNFRGTLDAQGRATASLIVPNTVGTPVSLYHAAVVYDNTGRFYFATNPASIGVR